MNNNEVLTAEDVEIINGFKLGKITETQVEEYVSRIDDVLKENEAFMFPFVNSLDDPLLISMAERAIVIEDICFPDRY